MKPIPVFLVLSVLIFSPAISFAITEDEFWKGVTEYENNQRHDLVQLCDQALKSKIGERADILAIRSVGYLNDGKAKQALKDAQEADKINNGFWRPYLALAYAYRANGDAKSGIAALKKGADNVSDEKRKKNFLSTAAQWQEIESAMPASQLYSEYDANEVAADSKFKGKIVTIKGTVFSITTDFTGEPIITFSGDKYGLKTIRAHFAKQDKPELAKVAKGQKVVISGKCDGRILTGVVLRDSKILQ